VISHAVSKFQGPVETYRYDSLRQACGVSIQRTLMCLVQNLLETRAHIWMPCSFGLYAAHVESRAGKIEGCGERQHYDGDYRNIKQLALCSPNKEESTSTYTGF
jgi:hypothetical protein